MMTADMIVGERVHMLLFRKKMTKRRLAEALGLTEQSLGKKVNGKSTFTLDELLAVSRLLDVPITDLLPGNDYDPAPTRGRGRKRELPRLDSNQQPSGYPSSLVRWLPTRRLEVDPVQVLEVAA